MVLACLKRENMKLNPDKPTENLSSNNVILISFVEMVSSSPTEWHSENEVLKPPKVRKMYLAAFCSLLLAISMGFITGYSAPATYDMKHRSTSIVKPTTDDITWIGSIIALGAMLGGIYAGPLADKCGRKIALIFNIIPLGIGWLLICYAKRVPFIIAGRFICGLGCGVISVTVPMYCVEISTSDVRGMLGSAFQGFLVIGNLISVFIGQYITWDQLALFAIIYTIFGVICFCPMPESPRWLLTKGKLDEAIAVVDYLQGGTIDASKECKRIFDDLENQPKGTLTWAECKCPTVYKPALISVFLMLFQQFSGANAVFFYSSEIFETSKEFLDPKIATVILGSIQVIATLLGNLIIDKTGRKVLLQLSGALMALNLALLGFYYFKSTSSESFKANYSWIPLLSLIFFVIAFSIGYGSVPWLLAAELVPLRARSTVGGLATFANGIFAFLVTKTFSDVQTLLGSYGTFWFYGGMSLTSVLFVTLALPETKGKQLDAISSLFKKSKKLNSVTSVNKP